MQYPHFGEDLFSEEALKAPFAHYRAIRDAGPVVYLPKPDVLAIGRFADVQAALRAATVLVSGEGIGFNKLANAQTAERGVLTSDGTRHRRLRSVLAKPLAPAAIKEQRALLKDLIAAQVATLVGGDTFDAIPLLARHLPLTAVTRLVGLDDGDRDRMLAWASAFFNTLAPIDDPDRADQSFTSDIDLLLEVRHFFATVDPAKLAPGSWSAKLFEAVGQGKLTESEARGALRAFVIPSLDTTIYAKGNLLYNLAVHPEQFELLRRNPELIPGAVLESIRHSAVVRWFSRVSVEDYCAGDVFVPKGSRIMLIYGSANRDERRYDEPDRFDITRNPTDHLGFGTGPHMCIGMHLARMEMEVMLEALVEQVSTLDCDLPTMGSNSGLYGIDELPFRLM
jgi:cytochrome P450